MENSKNKVVIAGASGYIGQNLLKKLKNKANLVGLSRNKRKDTKEVEWRSCDLFSLADAEDALKDADVAVYLVHSMIPSAKLTQASFEDMDVILADNFARAAKRQNVKEIIYLSGIIPDNDQHLSRHLSSRLEVENILRYYGTPVTAIRAGLVVGPNGSSFPILAKLVQRLPAMILPRWTSSKTQPVALDDVLNSLSKVILNTVNKNRSIDIGGPDVMTYRSMMEETARILEKKRYMFNVPLFSLSLSKFWLRLITQTPKEIVYPLVESLTHEMIVQDSKYVKGISDGKIPFREAAKIAIDSDKNNFKAKKKRAFSPLIQDVRSIQRIPLPHGQDADWVGRYYTVWLENFLNPWIKTETDNKLNCKIGFLNKKLLMLELSYSSERSTPDRALYYINDGILTDKRKNKRGRMEFRKIPGKDEAIIAIHDYTPSLPWFIYYLTQANAHLFVMNAFKNHIKKINDGKIPVPDSCATFQTQ